MSIPGGETATPPRASSGRYEYEDRPVSSGGQITVGQNRSVLTDGSDDTRTARAERGHDDHPYDMIAEQDLRSERVLAGLSGRREPDPGQLALELSGDSSARSGESR